MNLGAAIKDVRVYNNMTQEELANLIEISQSFLSEIESNKKVLTIKLAEKIAEAFNMRLSKLIKIAESWKPVVVYPSTDTLLKFVFNELPEEEQYQIEIDMIKDETLFDTISGLFRMKRELKTKEALENYLEELKERMRKRLFTE